MYYLDCVGNVLDMKENTDMSLMRDFKNYASLPDEQDETLVELAKAFGPHALENKVFFDHIELCHRNSNKYFELKRARKMFEVPDTVKIKRRRYHVKQIMTFRSSWMHKYYYQPYREMKEKVAIEHAAQLAFQAAQQRIKRALFHL